MNDLCGQYQSFMGSSISGQVILEYIRKQTEQNRSKPVSSNSSLVSASCSCPDFPQCWSVSGELHAEIHLFLLKLPLAMVSHNSNRNTK